MKLLLILLTVLQSLFATFEQKTFESDFEVTIKEPQMQSMTYSGDIKMYGKQFLLNMFPVEAAYDGRTLYIYSEDIDELSLSIPTQEELLQTNPFLFAQALMPVCQSSEIIVGDKTQITLVPDDQSAGIQKFVLYLTTATKLPTSIEIYESTGTTTVLRLFNAHFTDVTPSFIIQKEGAYINDLR